jgi:arylsulfatase A-like enzyme/Tfp pilus assembly protein PilF
MTSHLPPTTGIHYNEGFYLDNSAVTLAEVLSEEGYNTSGVIAAIVLDSRTGIAQGFKEYNDEFPAFTAYQKNIKVLESQFSYTQRRAEEVTDRVLELAVSIPDDEPLFLFAHYFDPHFPKDSPPPYSNIVDPLLKAGSGERQAQLYDGEIAYTDEHIGRLISGLEEQGLLENTLIVFTGDHGEGLDEHGERTHAYFVYDQTIHIPLIFSMPGRLPEGLIYEGLAGHIDIVPTVLDIIGVKWRDEYNFQGKSLFPFEEGSGRDLHYLECAGPFVMFGWSGLRGVRSLDWKYIQAPQEELYHISEDPFEIENLIEKKPAIADSLKEEMNRIIAGIEIYKVDETEEKEVSSEKDLIADRDFQDKLRALGYIGTTGDFTTTYEKMFDSSLPDPKDKLPDFYKVMLSIISMRLGIVDLDSDSLDSAMEHFLAAIEMNPVNTEAHFYLGLTYTNLQRYEDAGRELEKTREIEPGHIGATLALVNLHIVEEDTLKALEELESVFSSSEPNEKELVIMGRFWKRLGRTDRMVKSLEGALEKTPSHVPALLYLGEHYLTIENHQTACSYLEPMEGEVEESDSLAVRVYYALGKCYYGRGDLDRAELSFDRMIEIDSMAVDGYNQLGLISDDRSEYEEAVGFYEQALSLDDSRHEIHSNLGVTNYKMGRYTRSREEFEEYLRHVDDDEEVERLKAFIQHIKEMERSQTPPTSNTP